MKRVTPAVFGWLRGALGPWWLGMLLLAGCSNGMDPLPAPVWPEADALFHRGDPRWLGADAAYSVDLGAERVLWMFGDTFVSRPGTSTRSGADFPRNTIAIQHGYDPTTASIDFHFRTSSDDHATGFWVGDGDAWIWPAGGVRLSEGPLVVFLQRVVATGSGGIFGFTSGGVRVAIIDDPSGNPDDWVIRMLDAPAPPFDAVLGDAVVRDGDYLVTIAYRYVGQHAGMLARVPVLALLSGSFDGLEWWTGEQSGWVATAELAGEPLVVLDDAGPECSLHFDATRSRWVHVFSRGFPSSTVAVHTASALTGPWSAARDVLTPPEYGRSDLLIYAAKAHPELTAPHAGLAVTYATNAFDFASLFSEPGTAVYWPHFVPLDPSDFE